MKIAIVGVTGNVGVRLLSEALLRDHSVTGIARNPFKFSSRINCEFVGADANAVGSLAPKLIGCDAVVLSVPFRYCNHTLLLEAVRTSGVGRVVMVGNAAALKTASGELLMDLPQFPGSARREAIRSEMFLDAMRTVDDLEWTALSPAEKLCAGDRTGMFRTGEDWLLVADDGRSWISYDDYAVALLDELEQPKHVQKRFTVGY